MGTEYEEHLLAKGKIINDLIRSFGPVKPAIGAANPYHYRNKVHAAVGGDRNGNLYAGTYEPGTHKVVAVEKCLLDNEKADAIINSVVKLAKSFKYRYYNEDSKRGFLRHVLVRTAHATGEIMVTLVVGETIFPSKNNFIKALLKEHPEITTIIMNLNDRRTSMILGDREQVLYGKGYIEDVICNKRFKISSKSFYQVNSEQTELLYAKAVEYAGLTGKEVIMDAYSGIGTIGIIASDKAKTVVGVESNREAVNDAKVNLRFNKCQNVRYVAADAGEFMQDEAASGHKYDVVFMDPPRVGSDEKFIDSVVKLAPARVVYISCNPETLARDLKLFKKKGYVMKECTPVDLFSWTMHVETVILMTRCGFEEK